MRSILCSVTVISFLILTLQPAFGTVSATPEDASQNRRQIKADGVVYIEGDRPVCKVGLESDEIRPRFIQPPDSARSPGRDPFAQLPNCDGEQIHKLAMIKSIEMRSRVAAFPFVVAVPILVCAAGAGIGAFVGHEALRLIMTDAGGFVYSSMGVAAGIGALGMIFGTKITPIESAALLGGLIGAVCSMGGMAGGAVYYSYYGKR